MTVRILQGDVREQLATLPTHSVHCVVTSPPYWGLRAYLKVDHIDKPLEIGQEPRLDCLGWARGENCGSCYICTLRNVFAGVWRVLRDDGTLWINQGDSYHNGDKGGYLNGRVVNSPIQAAGNLANDFVGAANRQPQPGLKPKDICAQPWRLALALQADGWYWRDEIIWHKKSCMPSSQRDRCTRSHEVVLMFSKSERYYYDIDAIKEPAQIDTEARYERGRSDDHKYADGGPGNQTLNRGFDHIARDSWKGSTFDKGKTGEVKHTRGGTKVPAGWDTEPGAHGAEKRRPDKDQGRVDQGLKPAERIGGGAGWRDDPGARPSMATKRTVWSLGPEPFKEAHFATYPTKLVEPMILAGTSALGVCAACGSPWARKVSREFIPQGDVSEAKGIRGADGQKPLDVTDGRDGFPRGTTTTTTTGWAASCKCDAGDPVPATVLDIFGGAGTTALVADRHGRDAILLELNAEYAAMAKARIYGDSPLFAEVT